MLTKNAMVTLEGSYSREALINIVRTTKYYLRRAPPPIPIGYRAPMPYLLDEPIVGADLPGYVTGAHYKAPSICWCRHRYAPSKPTHPPRKVKT